MSKEEFCGKLELPCGNDPSGWCQSCPKHSKSTAANKAAEEGGLPATIDTREFRELLAKAMDAAELATRTGDPHRDYKPARDALVGHIDAQLHAADRASRQVANKAQHDIWGPNGEFAEFYVAGFEGREICPTTKGNALAAYSNGIKDRVANKAEVEPVSWRAKCEALIDIWDDARLHAPSNRCYAENAWPEIVEEVRSALATPPATTSTSTVRNQTLEEAAIAVQSMGDLNPPISFGVRCAEAIRKLKNKQVGASTVLTDERIDEIARQGYWYGRMRSWGGFKKDDDGKYTVPMLSKMHYDFAREVAAQVGQVAVPETRTELDGWNAAAKALAERAAGHYRNKDFELQDECLQCASMLHDLKPFAPSPAKESK